MHQPRDDAPARRAARRLIAALALAFFSTLNAAAQEATMDQATTGIIPYPTHVEVLDNGLKIILMPTPSNGLVAYWTIVRTGSRDEYEPGHTGFAHFFEHMMFRGTKAYPAERYQAVLTRIGADVNAFTTDDFTAFHLSFAAPDLEQVMQLESDRFEHLDYSEQSFKTEAGAVYGEYRKSRTSPFFTIYEKLMQTAFTAHPYSHTTMGFERDIAAMPTMYDYSRSFFARYYRPDNAVLLIVGDIDNDSVMALVRKYYGDWKSGYAPPEIPAEPRQHEPREVEVSYDGRALPILWISYKIDAFDPANRARVAVDLLSELAFGPTSELYKRLVLDEQLVDSLANDANWNRDPTLLDVYARVKDPSKVAYVRSVIEDTIERYQTDLVDPQRLRDLKSRLKYGFLMDLDTPDDIAEQLARPIAITGGLDDVEALYRAYDSVAPEEIRAAALGYLVPQRRTIAILRARE